MGGQEGEEGRGGWEQGERALCKGKQPIRVPGTRHDATVTRSTVTVTG